MVTRFNKYCSLAERKITARPAQQYMLKHIAFLFVIFTLVIPKAIFAKSSATELIQFGNTLLKEGDYFRAIGQGSEIVPIIFEKINVVYALRADQEAVDYERLPNGLSQQFKAIAQFSDGHTENFSDQVAWSVSDGQVVDVSDQGLVTAIASQGTYVVKATHNNITYDSELLEVALPITISIHIDPEGPVTLFKGESVEIHVFKTLSSLDASGKHETVDVTIDVDLTFENTKIVLIEDGDIRKFKALSKDVTALVLATLNEVSQPLTDTLEFQLLPEKLTAIKIGMVGAGSIFQGTQSQKQFFLTGEYTDSVDRPMTSGMTWSVSDANIVSIDQNGLLKTKTDFVLAQPKEVTVFAEVSFQGIAKAERALIITEPKTTQISLSVGNNETVVLPKGRSLLTPVVATATNSIGRQKNVTNEATWSLSAITPQILDAYDKGLITASKEHSGEVVVSVHYEGASASFTVKVTQAELDHIVIRSRDANQTGDLAAGRDRQFDAFAYFSDEKPPTQVTTSGSTSWQVDTQDQAFVKVFSNSGNEIKGLIKADKPRYSANYRAFYTHNGMTKTFSVNVASKDAVIDSAFVVPTSLTVSQGRDLSIFYKVNKSDGTQGFNLSTDNKTHWEVISNPSLITLSKDFNNQSARVIGSLTQLGDAQIKVTYDGGFQKIVNVTVTAAVEDHIRVEPVDLNLKDIALAYGLDRQFKTVLVYSNNSEQTLSSGVTWNAHSGARRHDVEAKAAQGWVSAEASSGEAVIEATYGLLPKQSVRMKLKAAETIGLSYLPAITFRIAQGKTEQLPYKIYVNKTGGLSDEIPFNTVQWLTAGQNYIQLVYPFISALPQTEGIGDISYTLRGAYQGHAIELPIVIEPPTIDGLIVYKKDGSKLNHGDSRSVFAKVVLSTGGVPKDLNSNEVSWHIDADNSTGSGSVDVNGVVTAASANGYVRVVGSYGGKSNYTNISFDEARVTDLRISLQNGATATNVGVPSYLEVRAVKSDGSTPSIVAHGYYQVSKLSGNLAEPQIEFLQSGIVKPLDGSYVNLQVTHGGVTQFFGFAPESAVVESISIQASFNGVARTQIRKGESLDLTATATLSDTTSGPINLSQLTLSSNNVHLKIENGKIKSDWYDGSGRITAKVNNNNEVDATFIDLTLLPAKISRIEITANEYGNWAKFHRRYISVKGYRTDHNPPSQNSFVDLTNDATFFIPNADTSGGFLAHLKEVQDENFNYEARVGNGSIDFHASWKDPFSNETVMTSEPMRVTFIAPVIQRAEIITLDAANIHSGNWRQFEFRVEYENNNSANKTGETSNWNDSRAVFQFQQGTLGYARAMLGAQPAGATVVKASYLGTVYSQSFTVLEAGLSGLTFNAPEVKKYGTLCPEEKIDTSDKFITRDLDKCELSYGSNIVFSSSSLTATYADGSTKNVQADGYELQGSTHLASMWTLPNGKTSIDITSRSAGQLGIVATYNSNKSDPVVLDIEAFPSEQIYLEKKCSFGTESLDSEMLFDDEGAVYFIKRQQISGNQYKLKYSKYRVSDCAVLKSFQDFPTSPYTHIGPIQDFGVYSSGNIDGANYTAAKADRRSYFLSQGKMILDKHVSGTKVLVFLRGDFAYAKHNQNDGRPYYIAFSIRLNEDSNGYWGHVKDADELGLLKSDSNTLQIFDYKRLHNLYYPPGMGVTGEISVLLFSDKYWISSGARSFGTKAVTYHYDDDFETIVFDRIFDNLGDHFVDVIQTDLSKDVLTRFIYDQQYTRISSFKVNGKALASDDPRVAMIIPSGFGGPGNPRGLTQASLPWVSQHLGSAAFIDFFIDDGDNSAFSPIQRARILHASTDCRALSVKAVSQHSSHVVVREYCGNNNPRKDYVYEIRNGPPQRQKQTQNVVIPSIVTGSCPNEETEMYLHYYSVEINPPQNPVSSRAHIENSRGEWAVSDLDFNIRWFHWNYGTGFWYFDREGIANDAGRAFKQFKGLTKTGNKLYIYNNNVRDRGTQESLYIKYQCGNQWYWKWFHNGFFDGPIPYPLEFDLEGATPTSAP